MIPEGCPRKEDRRAIALVATIGPALFFKNIFGRFFGWAAHCLLSSRMGNG
jgi:hypothetical protein